MARNSGKMLDEQNLFSGNLTPIGQRRLRQPQLRGQPDEEAALSTQEVHPLDGIIISAHKGNLAPPDITAQEENTSTQEAFNSASVENPSHSNQMEIGVLIRRARQRLGLTQGDLSKRLDVQQSAVSQWEVGHVKPDLKNRLKLASVLGIPLEDVMPPGTIAGSAGEPPEADSDEVQQLVQNYRALPRAMRSTVQLLVLGLKEALRNS